jgi:hypothetical protein
MGFKMAGIRAAIEFLVAFGRGFVLRIAGDLVLFFVLVVPLL